MYDTKISVKFLISCESDLNNFSYSVGGHLLKNADQATTPEEGAKMIENTLVDGTALDKFRLMMRAQGVAGDLADQLCKKGSNIADLLPKAKHTRIIKSPSTGASNLDRLIINDCINYNTRCLFYYNNNLVW